MVVLEAFVGGTEMAVDGDKKWRAALEMSVVRWVVDVVYGRCRWWRRMLAGGRGVIN